MPSSGLGAYQVKIHQIVFGGLFFLVVLIGVRGMMAGGGANLKLLGSLSVAVAVILVLDRYYWLLCPAFFVANVRIPGLPFDNKELGCILLVVVYFVRQALRKEHSISFDSRFLISLPIFFWICFIWVLNPTGMTMLGSESIGARFYFQFILGFLMFVVLSTLRLSEKDCKIMFRFILALSIYSTVVEVIETRVALAMSSVQADELGSHYELLGSLELFLLLFSRYALSKIMTSPVRLSLAGLFFMLVVYSGKRRGIGTLFFVPVLRSFFTNRDKTLTVVVGGISAVLLGLAIVGHGLYYELPRSAQRTLGVFVPKFAENTAGGIRDVFREEVRRRATDIVRRNPWVGRKGFAMDRSETIWLHGSQGEAKFDAHAYAGNWHSTWYAWAADFGLPAVLMGGALLLYALVYAYRGFRRCQFGLYSKTCFLFYAMSLYIFAIFSYTSGHGAHSLVAIWLNYGMMIAIQEGWRSSQL